jgi:hypothetical protein
MSKFLTWLGKTMHRVFEGTFWRFSSLSDNIIDGYMNEKGKSGPPVDPFVE